MIHALHHILWLIHHGYAHRAALELKQIVWAETHGVKVR